MKLNAIQTHEVICGWIATAKTEQQLAVCQMFIVDTFSKRFPIDINTLHKQMVDNMLNKIDQRQAFIGCNPEGAHQRFPVSDEHPNNEHGH